MNTLDFLNSIAVFDSSKLKDHFELIDEHSKEGSTVLDHIHADTANRIYFKKKFNNNNDLSQLISLVKRFNSSLKKDESPLNFRQDILTSKQIKADKFLDMTYQVTFSLPKENYIEARLICGASISDIINEVASDNFQKQRMDSYLEEAKLFKMFPPAEGNKCDFNGFTILSKKDSNGFYNAILDSKGRELAELVKVDHSDDNLRDTYNIAFRFSSKDSEHINNVLKDALGYTDEISFSDLSKLSEYFDRNGDDSILVKNFPIQISTFDYDSDWDSNSDEFYMANSSSPYDSEEIVAKLSDPFKSTGPYEIDTEKIKEKEQAIYAFKSRKIDNKRINPLQQVIRFEQFDNLNPSLDPNIVLKDELGKKLKDFSKLVGAQEIGLDMIMARIEVIGESFEDEYLLKSSLNDISNLHADIDKEITIYSSNAYDDVFFKNYVSELSKLNKSLQSLKSSISMDLSASNDIEKKNSNLESMDKKNELGLTKNDLHKKLPVLQNEVAKNEDELRIFTTRLKVRNLNLFEEKHLDNFLLDLHKCKTDIVEDLNIFTPKAEKDDDFQPYVKALNGLNNRLANVDFSLKNIMGDERYNAVLFPNQVPPSTKKPEVKEDISNIKSKNPAQTIVGIAHFAPMQSDKNGSPIIPNVPNFRVQFNLLDIQEKIDKMNITRHKDGDLMNFAIVRYKKGDALKNPFVVIAQRQGQPAIVNGTEVKYSDASALLEFSINIKELKDKAQKVGVDLNNNIPLIVGFDRNKPIVNINDKSKFVTNKDVSSYTFKLTKGTVEVVNQFDRIIKTKQNLQAPDMPKIRFEHLDLGNGIAHRVNSSKKHSNIFFYLEPDKIKNLPECDAFGNVKIAICARKDDTEYLKANTIHLDNRGNFLNQKGERVPEFRVIADPMTYKNGQPYDSTQIVLTLRKDDLLNCPVLNRKEGNFFALDYDALNDKVSLNSYKYITNNQSNDLAAYLKITPEEYTKTYPMRINSLTTIPSQSLFLKKDDYPALLQAWKLTTDMPSKEEFKNSPTQWDIFTTAVGDMKEQQAKDINENIKKSYQNNLDQNINYGLNKGVDKDDDNIVGLKI